MKTKISNIISWKYVYQRHRIVYWLFVLIFDEEVGCIEKLCYSRCINSAVYYTLKINKLIVKKILRKQLMWSSFVRKLIGMTNRCDFQYIRLSNDMRYFTLHSQLCKHRVCKKNKWVEKEKCFLFNVTWDLLTAIALPPQSRNSCIQLYCLLVDSAISFTYTSNVAAVASKECVNIVKLIMYLILKA